MRHYETVSYDTKYNFSEKQLAAIPFFEMASANPGDVVFIPARTWYSHTRHAGPQVGIKYVVCPSYKNLDYSKRTVLVSSMQPTYEMPHIMTCMEECQAEVVDSDVNADRC